MHTLIYLYMHKISLEEHIRNRYDYCHWGGEQSGWAKTGWKLFIVYAFEFQTVNPLLTRKLYLTLKKCMLAIRSLFINCPLRAPATMCSTFSRASMGGDMPKHYRNKPRQTGSLFSISRVKKTPLIFKLFF